MARTVAKTRAKGNGGERRKAPSKAEARFDRTLGPVEKQRIERATRFLRSGLDMLEHASEIPAEISERWLQAADRMRDALHLRDLKDVVPRRVARAIALLDNVSEDVERRCKAGFPRDEAIEAEAKAVAGDENYYHRHKLRPGDLGGIPHQAWVRAIHEWRGRQPVRRGPSTAGQYRWREVVHALLFAGGLVRAEEAGEMERGFKIWEARAPEFAKVIL